MYQPKVTQTEKYTDNQGNIHTVCRGKLVLVEKDAESNSLLTKSSIGYISKREGDIIYDPKGLDPIIISETEEIEVGDKVYDDLHKEQRDHYNKNKKRFFKVLSLPEHFSDKHLQAIVDGKLKQGKVLVKCTPDYDNPPEGYYTHRGSGKYHEDEPVIMKRILTNPDKPIPFLVDIDIKDHITLFPAQQSLEEAFKQYMKENHRFKQYMKENHGVGFIDSIIEKAFKSGAEWAKKNNY